MSDRDDQSLGFETLAVRAGQHRTAESEHSEPIFPTSSYVFDSAAAARFSGEQPGNIYSRFTNPTVRCFEERLAALTNIELTQLTHTIAHRVARYLERQGLLERDADDRQSTD